MFGQDLFKYTCIRTKFSRKRNVKRKNFCSFSLIVLLYPIQHFFLFLLLLFQKLYIKFFIYFCTQNNFVSGYTQTCHTPRKVTIVGKIYSYASSAKKKLSEITKILSFLSFLKQPFIVFFVTSRCGEKFALPHYSTSSDILDQNIKKRKKNFDIYTSVDR